MRRIIIFESADNLGKTTQVELLKDKLDAHVIVQPSGDNHVGFLRDIVKGDPDFGPFERQLMHTCSHIVDAFTNMHCNDTIIMDRCYISALVYGYHMGMTHKQLGIMQEIHQCVYTNVLNHSIHLIILTADYPLKGPDDSVHENTVEWQDINRSYSTITPSSFDTQGYGNCWFTSRDKWKDEKRDTIDVTGRSIQTVHNHILNTLGEDHDEYIW